MKLILKVVLDDGTEFLSSASEVKNPREASKHLREIADSIDLSVRQKEKKAAKKMRARVELALDDDA